MTYIVVEGPIGVGKTALTRLLGEHMALPTVFEQFEENPFLTCLTLSPDQASTPAYRSPLS
jgi:deoxyguanosine kinase